jgi:hypothetical protein
MAKIANGQHDVSPFNGRTRSPTSTSKPAMEPNVKEVVLGNLWINTWYPSFYSEELVGKVLDRLYVCQWCFKYTKNLVPYIDHTVSGTKLYTLYS